MPTKRSTGSAVGSMRTSFEQYLDDFGTSVTVTSRTETLDSMNRVIGTTESSTTVKADIQWVSKKDLQYLNSGNVQVADGMIFFKYNQSISLNDEITFNERTWRIIEQIEGELVGGDVVYNGYIIRKHD